MVFGQLSEKAVLLGKLNPYAPESNLDTISFCFWLFTGLFVQKPIVID